MVLKKWYHKVISNGLAYNGKRVDISLHETFNTIASSLIVFTLIAVIVELTRGNKVGSYVAISFFLFTLFLYYLSFKGYYKFAVLIICIVFSSAIMALSVAYSGVLNLGFYMGTFALLAIFFIQKKSIKYSVLSFLLLIYIVSISYQNTNPPLLGHKMDLFTNIAMSIIFLLMAYQLTVLFFDKLLKGENKVDKLVFDLKEQKQKLIESNEKLEQFVGLVSHDLKTPLRSISSFAGLIDKKIKDKGLDKINSYSKIIVDNAKHMTNMIHNTLTYSALGNEVECEIIDLNNLCTTIQNFYSQDDTIDFNFEKLPIIKANYSLIFKVFQNIIENAIKYNQSEIKHIKVNCLKDKSFVNFYFSDNGIGIPKEYKDQIFELYKRLHSNSEYEGTGLGLAISKKVIEEMDGKIMVENQESGKGSCLVVSLPISIIVKNQDLFVA